MKRQLATALLSLACFSAHAEDIEVHLRCQANMDQKVDGVLFENKDGILEIRIREATFRGVIHRFISTNGIFQTSVQGQKTDPIYYADDTSNEKEWNIINRAKGRYPGSNKDVSDLYISVVINRYTGTVNTITQARDLSDKSLVVVQLQGNCQRIDASKKRF